MSIVATLEQPAGRRIDPASVESASATSAAFDRPGIAPGVSPGRGRGLFATAPHAAGVLLERCCTIPLTSAQCDALEGILPLGNYYFRHPENAEEGLLLLGLISLANHSEEPNALVRYAHAGSIGWVAELVALRPIEAGEEITHRYRCSPWFEIA